MSQQRPDRSRRTFRPTADPLEGRIAPATLPPGFVESAFVTDLDRPTTMQFAPDGRLFIAEQDGAVRVVEDGWLLDEPFLRLDVDARGERGLIGLAFDPDFDANGFVYVHYTVPGTSPNNRVSRFEAEGNLARAGSEQVLLDLEPLSAAINHNGGPLAFGPDGTLFVAVGDNAEPDLAQRLDSRLGKILRINPDGSIPADNPFADQADGPNRAIWATGLRNPFSLAVQPGTGTPFINDVGERSFEEINVGMAGANYGWPETEGPTDDPRFVGPIFAYPNGRDRSQPTEGCSIVGSAFVPDSGPFPSEMAGEYLFADFCTGWIRRLDPDDGSVRTFVTGLPSGTVDLEFGPDGALYVLSRGGAEATVIRIAAEPQPPVDPPEPGPIDDGAFVGQLYLDVLGRQASPAEVLGWTTALEAGTDRAEVVRIFEGSEERLVGLITDSYERLLGRAPDGSGLAGWLGVLQAGGTREQVIEGIAASPEYFQRQGGTAEGFVRGLYLDLLGRQASDPEAASWAALVASPGRSDVARAIAASEEAFLAHVTDLYLARLRRPLSETDRGLWSDQHRAGLRSDVAAFFITASPEYTQRRA